MSDEQVTMLDYENQLFLDAIHGNELFIFGKGIFTEQVMKNIFKAYTTETSLVFVLGASSGEEKYFKGHLQNEKIYSITTEVSAADRKDMYTNGGVFFVTSRILIVDLLKEIFPINKVTGIIVLRAHNVIETSQEAFILRLYRTKNKEGFIKAFSQSPAAFLLGFSRLQRVMRSCFLANVSLWPRFHQLIKDSLKVVPDGDDSLENVIEIQLNLTEEMREIQSNLLDLVSWSVSELKRLVPALNDEEINAETALTSGFQKILGAHMDAEWNTINEKAKELLSDIKIFRLLLTYLTKCDCVSFYAALSAYTSSEMAFKSSWIVSPAAEKIIVAAKRRLVKHSKIQNTTIVDNRSKSRKNLFQPEVSPKWLAVSEILNDIFVKDDNKEEAIVEEESQDSEGSVDLFEEEPPVKKRLTKVTSEEEEKSQSSSPDMKTLIFVEDSKTCHILRDYLTDGSLITLGRLVQNNENIKIDLPENLVSKLTSLKKKDDVPHGTKSCETKMNNNQKGRSSKKDDDTGQEEDDESKKSHSENEKDEDVQITLTQIQRKYESVETFPSPVFIRPYRSVNEDDVFVVTESLLLFKPDVIVIFDPELELVRQIERHRARMSPQQNIRVYFLAFRNSVEEQIYLTSIQREKLAFERLIDQKATMLVPKEREARDELNQDLWRDPSRASDTTTLTSQSRRNMEIPVEGRETVLVDIREFRSELPSLLHKRGIDLEPLTLDVGDYILTPDICVERKSISDLIGSLNTGRMYKQAEAMGRHYKKSILLIEHEQKALLPSKYSYRSDLAQAMPKLQILTIHFPNLRIIWSPGAHYTSEVFHELKKGKPQPNAEEALSIHKESIGDHISTKYNPVTHSFLSKMPGIDSRNVYALLNRCDNLQELVNLSEKELEEILENSHSASILYAGLHSESLIESADAASSSSSSKSTKLKTARALVKKQKSSPFFRASK